MYCFPGNIWDTLNSKKLFFLNLKFKWNWLSCILFAKSNSSTYKSLFLSLREVTKVSSTGQEKLFFPVPWQFVVLLPIPVFSYYQRGWWAYGLMTKMTTDDGSHLLTSILPLNYNWFETNKKYEWVSCFPASLSFPPFIPLSICEIPITLCCAPPSPQKQSFICEGCGPEPLYRRPALIKNS